MWPFYLVFGSTLLPLRRDNMLMAVPVRLSDSTIEVGQARELFRTAFRNNALPYDVSDDGRFLINRSVDEQAPVPITLVVNWPELLRRR